MCNNCGHKLEDKLNPADFEQKIYQNWLEKGYFKSNVDKSKKPYTIVMPPPNVTGKLHMGHALDNTMQDILIRYKRMAGYNSLWIPGTDHAAIATEVKVVEKIKEEEGLSKEEVGREGFLQRAWAWKEEYGNSITTQLKRLGSSCDWSKEAFTMSEELSQAVKTVFVNLYNKGLIYKGKRMINWCPDCSTSISDAEVEYEEEQTKLWHIKYQIKETDEFITIATTRPETMLGDTAVAVHPEDERYRHLAGRMVILPIMNKEIPIIQDSFVETEFGTGVVKITPAHDMNDYQVGLKHQLEMPEVFDDHFKMGSLISEYEGMDLLTARKCIVKKLEELGCLVKVEDYTHNVGKCYRCHTTVEPKISEQWFVKMKPLAEPAIKVVKEEKTKFVPERFDKIYFNWMENIQDWCISRQLWWGHRIPAYYCERGHMVVAEEMPEKCPECGSVMRQDEDTLDTWFSSALWPFSTLGWPKKTEELDYFYPTDVLVTAYDIIFFWVARMIFSGIEHMSKTPFHTVFIHGLIRDSQGRKMSKSLGNGIDPIDLIEKYGADSLRFSLTIGTSPGNDIRYGEERAEAASNFANKLWNASKFVLMNLEDYDEKTNLEDVTLQYEDKWILSKLNTLAQEVRNNIDKYEIGIALDKIYTFIWNEFCDWYIEMVKPRLYDKEGKTRVAAQAVLNKVLKDAVALLHPFMPFITEEIYQRLYGIKESIMIEDYPEYKKEFAYSTEEVEELKQMIIEVRNVRANRNVHPSKKANLIFVTTKHEDFLNEAKDIILKLAFGSNLEIRKEETDIPEKATIVITPNMKLFIPFADLVDIEEERARLEKEKEKIIIEKAKTEGMLSSQGFLQKAPPIKIQEEKEKLANFNEKIRAIEESIKNL